MWLSRLPQYSFLLLVTLSYRANYWDFGHLTRLLTVEPHTFHSRRKVNTNDFNCNYCFAVMNGATSSWYKGGWRHCFNKKKTCARTYVYRHVLSGIFRVANANINCGTFTSSWTSMGQHGNGFSPTRLRIKATKRCRWCRCQIQIYMSI